MHSEYFFVQNHTKFLNKVKKKKKCLIGKRAQSFAIEVSVWGSVHWNASQLEVQELKSCYITF